MTTPPSTRSLPGTPGHEPDSGADHIDDTPATGSASVFDTMGTVVSFRAPPHIRSTLTADLQAIFRNHDERFSLHMPDSELSRVAAGRLLLSRSSTELRNMYALAVEWRNATDGLFDPCDRDGRLDLNGVVKAHALHQAGEYLRQQGVRDWALNCGGDILCNGHQSTDIPWAIGISDPADRSAMLARVTTSPDRMAIATSGVSERGHHIWSPTKRKASRSLVQASVSAADIVTADVLATAIYAGGNDTIDDMAQRFEVDIYTVDADGQTRWVSGRPSVDPTGTGTGGHFSLL
jgi:thiamine biosynthesis lipoprotein